MTEPRLARILQGGNQPIAMPVVGVSSRSAVRVMRRRVRSHHGTDSVWLRLSEGSSVCWRAVLSGRGWEQAP